MSQPAPTGLHVHILPSGLRSGVSTAGTWHRYQALYGESYRWAEPTAAELAEYHAENARLDALPRAAK